MSLSKTGVHFVGSLYWGLRWKLANRVFKKMLWRWQKLWSRWRRKKLAAKARVSGKSLKSGHLRMHFEHSRAKIKVFKQNTDIIKGTCSRFSACLIIKMLFFCRDMLYLLYKQYDHVIMSSKNQYAHSPGSHFAHSPGSHFIKFCENNCKLMTHGIKPSGQQYIQRW